MCKVMKRAMAMVLACLTVVGMVTAAGGSGFAVDADACSTTGSVSALGYTKYQAPQRDWRSVTTCRKHSASNEDGHYADVRVGNWNTRSGKLKDSVRFCVSNKKDYRNTHYINYMLNGDYTQMTGLVSFSDKSERFAEADVKIYLDNELAYDSITLSALSDDDDFTLDVEDVNVVRIVCSTTGTETAYCVVAASVR